MEEEGVLPYSLYEPVINTKTRQRYYEKTNQTNRDKRRTFQVNISDKYRGKNFQ